MTCWARSLFARRQANFFIEGRVGPDMFGKMRRRNQALSGDECLDILRSCSTGILGAAGPDGYPYAVPLNYAYDDGRIIFHCAREGHKLDCIRHSEKVSFCVVQSDQVVPQAFATDYRSVIIFGRARVLTDDRARRQALEKLNEKYSPQFPEEGRREIERGWNAVCIVEIEIEHLTGKEAKKPI
ncbi:MAG: pyridoxamine 5'-phosphate oxidase family protein [Methanomassiliicoccus sp.]|nr:pyridoxamine 5'-phosphate oxidase family protein [Methanomassiliicoccus sp.]